MTANHAERRNKVAFTMSHFFSGVRALARTNTGCATDRTCAHAPS